MSRKQAREVLLDAESPAPVSSASASSGNSRASTALFVAVGFACVSPVMFGYSISFTSSTQGTMEGDLVDGISPPADLISLTVEEESWYASLMNLACIVGAFSGSSLSDRFGRRRTLVLTVFPHVVGWVGTAFSESFLMLLIFRMIVGWGVGVGSAVTPVYIAEVAPTSLRGALGAANQLSVTFGIFLTNLLGAFGCTVEREAHKFTQWRTICFIGAGITLVLLGMAAMPESPRWFAKNGKAEEAETALRKMRVGDVSQELQEMVSSAAQSQGQSQGSPQQPISLMTYSRSLLVGIGMLTFQQLSGVNAVIMFAGNICASAGMGDGSVAAMAIMGIQVVLTGISCLLMERAGRRLLLLFGSMSMAIGHIVLAYYFLAQDVDGLVAPTMLALVALGVFIIGFALGLGPIPWLLLAEIFPTEVRSRAASLGTAQNWLCSFIVTLSFLPIQKAITKQGTFLMFSIVCVLCFLFVLVFVPETKGKSVDEVLKAMQGGERSSRQTSLQEVRETE